MTIARANFWHMKCGLNFMARKMNVLEIGQAARAEAAANHRQRTLLVTALDSMKPRPQAKKIMPPRPRLQIVVDDQTHTQMVEPVKIRHVD
jgi:hypothetical protein